MICRILPQIKYFTDFLLLSKFHRFQQSKKWENSQVRITTCHMACCPFKLTKRKSKVSSSMNCYAIFGLHKLGIFRAPDKSHIKVKMCHFMSCIQKRKLTICFLEFSKENLLNLNENIVLYNTSIVFCLQ